ncbi:hypothetical protein J6590_046252 [Homalodisca vitripennis]|nr:hypothetical protein J6590_046252 [Homalodisca vitripennis]
MAKVVDYRASQFKYVLNPGRTSVLLEAGLLDIALPLAIQRRHSKLHGVASNHVVLYVTG